MSSLFESREGSKWGAATERLRDVARTLLFSRSYTIFVIVHIVLNLALFIWVRSDCCPSGRPRSRVIAAFFLLSLGTYSCDLDFPFRRQFQLFNSFDKYQIIHCELPSSGGFLAPPFFPLELDEDLFFLSHFPLTGAGHRRRLSAAQACTLRRFRGLG